MNKMLEIKPLKYTLLPGFSEEQLKEHHDVLYAGYVKKLNEIEEKLKNSDTGLANATYSEYGELRRGEAFATNAIKLHESYFDNLGGDGKPAGKLLGLIKHDFESFEKFEKQFKAAGLAARGWVVLCFNWDDRKLHIYSSDYHTQGIWNCTPLLVLDVYEHAYFIDFKTARKAYIEAFWKVLDWSHLNKLVEKLEMEKYKK